MDNELIFSSLKILQLIYSFKSVNTLMINFSKDAMEKISLLKEGEDRFINTDYFSYFNEEILSLTILCAIRARKLLENSQIKTSSCVKFTSIGINIETKESVSYEKVLSKIIHSSSLLLETEGSYRAYSYDTDKSNPKTRFTGKMGVCAKDKASNGESILIDLAEFCLNNISIAYLLYF